MSRTAAPESIETSQVSTWAPPAWMNRMMIWFLRTPGLQRWLGRKLALITFKGRRSGKLYTTPVTYVRSGNEVIILSKRFRIWWRNLIDIPRIGLRLAGRNVRGHVEIVSDEDQSVPVLIAFLEQQPQDAAAYGLRVDEDGRIDPDQARTILPQLVVMRVTLVESADDADM